MTTKSRCQAGLQVPRKLGLDTEKCQTLPRSKHRPTTADAESLWQTLLAVAKASGELFVLVAVRLAIWVFASALLLLLLDAWRT